MFSVRCTVSLVYLSPLAALVAAPPQILQIVFTGTTCSRHSVAAVHPLDDITGGHPSQPPHPFGGESSLCLHCWEQEPLPPYPYPHRKHCKENPIYVFLFWELRGLSPNFHIHVSVSDLYIRSTYFLQQNRQTDCGNI